MNVQQSYNLWATQYDTNKNKTRDLEAQALRTTLEGRSFRHILEIGCGTGKNTEWLLTCAERVTAVDLSEGMLDVARSKINAEKVDFRQADITQVWNFGTGQFDLITFSLVLEHIEHLDPVFQEVRKALMPGGIVYVGELHPFKQYAGTQARFDTPEGRQLVPCINHHITDFLQAAERSGLQLQHLEEYFDDLDRSGIPRLARFVFSER
ncbi:MAG: class I SAM-dependent methyltransferase [Saprospiraceae bacterium]|nr:class I SAM-dependent methyltransferase [Saprospiraceae bacterium]